MNTTVVVIDPERFQLALLVERIPEKDVIEILATNCADYTFHKRTRNRHMRNRLDLADFEHAQVGKPAMKAKQWIMVGADVLR